jgi:hypothetical protein
MIEFAIRIAFRMILTFTTKDRALKQANDLARRYSEIAKSISVEDGGRCIEVPSMPGIDVDMRCWSFFMLLQHNTIVNRSISAMVQQLARNEPLTGAAAIDPKRDVMPQDNAGPEVVGEFLESISKHITAVRELNNLRATRTSRHPIFGDFDAHKWNGMFALHLRLHLKQAQYIAGKLARSGVQTV